MELLDCQGMVFRTKGEGVRTYDFFLGGGQKANLIAFPTGIPSGADWKVKLRSLGCDRWLCCGGGKETYENNYTEEP